MEVFDPHRGVYGLPTNFRSGQNGWNASPRRLDLPAFLYGLCGVTKNPLGICLNEFAFFLLNRHNRAASTPRCLQLKILIIGDAGTGKTCIARWLTENKHPTGTPVYSTETGKSVLKCTIISLDSTDFVELVVDYGDNLFVIFQIFDTGGQERFRTPGSGFYRGVNGMLLVYDVTNPESFQNIQRWNTERERYAPMAERIMVGNKIDLLTDGVVSKQEAERMAEALEIPHFEASALTGQNLEKIIFTLGAKILKSLDDVCCISTCFDSFLLGGS